MLDRFPLLRLLLLGVAALLVTYAIFLWGLWFFPERGGAFLALFPVLGILVGTPAAVLGIASGLLEDRPVAGLIRRRWLALTITFGLTYATFFWLMASGLPEQVDISSRDTVATLELLATPDLDYSPRGVDLPPKLKQERRRLLEGAAGYSCFVLSLGIIVAWVLDCRWARRAHTRSLLGRL